MQDFDSSQEVVTLGLSLYVLGFGKFCPKSPFRNFHILCLAALGPLVFAPLSEIYGRQILFTITYSLFVAFNLGAVASQNIWTVVILRFFAGTFGSSPLTNAGGVLADIFDPRNRGLAMAIFTSAPALGPVGGPIAGGFLAEQEGWRWLFGFMAILSAVALAGCLCFCPETYAPVLLQKRATKLSLETGKVYRSTAEIDQNKLPISKLFRTSLSRPWILLFCEPIVFLLSLYMAIIYGTLYLLFGAFPVVYEEIRGWSQGIGGLAFIGVAIGVTFAVLWNLFFENTFYLRRIERRGDQHCPEARLPMSLVGGVALPIGLFWFSWTNYTSIHWAVSVAAGIPFGFGMMLVFISIQTYLVDACKQIAQGQGNFQVTNSSIRPNLCSFCSCSGFYFKIAIWCCISFIYPQDVS
jgi:multidrug resistance protein